MVSRWKLDEGTGVTANDIWGLNNGSIIGSTWKNDTHCVSGKCLSFNGTISDYIDCGSDDSLNIRDKITVSMWVNPRTLPTLDSNQQTLYTRGNVYSFLILNYVNGKIYVLQSSGSGWINLAITSSQFLYINKWTHIAASYDSGSGEIKIFANGLNVKTSGNTPSQITSSIPTVIGARNGGSYSFDGLIDDVRIYNEALSSVQIKQNYIAGLNSMLVNGNMSKEEYNQKIETLSFSIK